jgi:DNA-binding protein YbaB
VEDARRALEHLVGEYDNVQRRIQECVLTARDETFSAAAADGSVTATVNGAGQLRELEIGVLAKRAGDNETMGDAVVEAVRKAEAAAKAGLVKRVQAALGPEYATFADPAHLRRLLGAAED